MPKKKSQTSKKLSPPRAKTITRRSRSGKKSVPYFTAVHEQAIAEYVRAKDNLELRNKLYVTVIQPVFSELVDKIVYTYKFTAIPNIDSLRDECKVWLTTIIDKFNPDAGKKAFSYFSVVTKNWFIHKTKEMQKRVKREVDLNSVSKVLESRFMSFEGDYYLQDRESLEFWDTLKSEMPYWGAEDFKSTDEKVLKAITLLFENTDRIEIFNKKAVYLYIREITGLNTKQVASALKKLREEYDFFKADWDAGDI